MIFLLDVGSVYFFFFFYILFVFCKNDVVYLGIYKGRRGNKIW